MEQLATNGWLIAYDAELTRKAYRQSSRGAHDCSCVSCRNFIAVRDQEYPSEFIELLAQVGITPHSEAEVYELGPTANGLRTYGGFYHFVGKVLTDPGTVIEFANKTGKAWHTYLHASRSLALDSFGGSPLVQLEFEAELPWGLTEPPVD